MSMNDDCGKNKLSLHNLCVDHVKGCHGKIDKIRSNEICSQSAVIKNLSAESEVVNNLCSAGSISANQLWSNQAYTTSICAQNATLQNACITNLKVGSFSFVPYTPYRATVNYSTNFTYTLGNFLNFDNIVDDPNNNIGLVPNTTYTAPLSGYYMLTFKANVTNVVSTSGPILGIPVANPEIYVNGVVVREGYSPFLSFFNTQKVIVDSLITLQQGDVVTMKYNILAGNGSQVTGTVDFVGSGIEDGNSLFKIIFMSVLVEGGSVTPPICPPCPPVVIPCSGVVTPCTPLSNCGDMDMPSGMQRQNNAFAQPCDSCQ